MVVEEVRSGVLRVGQDFVHMFDGLHVPGDWQCDILALRSGGELGYFNRLADVDERFSETWSSVFNMGSRVLVGCTPILLREFWNVARNEHVDKEAVTWERKARSRLVYVAP